LKKIICLLVTMILLVCATASAADTYGGYNIPLDIAVNGCFVKCSQKPIIIGGTTYIPLRAFSDAVGGAISWDAGRKLAVLEKGGHYFEFYPNQGSCWIDGVLKPYNSVLYANLTFVPVRAISETLGYGVSWDDFYLVVNISAPGVVVPDYYRDYSYTYEDILYLGKITQIESGYEPFAVQLGVADVVVNRMKSSKFPNTVKGVILDKKYGVQFPPAHTSQFDVTPTKSCIIAAKCALRGINVVGNSLYFIDKQAASYSWAAKNRPYFGTIHSMNFYE